LGQLIVADAGPLIALSFADSIELLSAMYCAVIVPRAVEIECLSRPDKPGGLQLKEAFAKGWLSRQPQTPILSGIRIATLDDGESAAIELADLLSVPLLIDERRGRAVARSKGILIVGTLGLLVMARRKSLIPALNPILQTMRKHGYYLSDELLRATLASVIAPPPNSYCSTAPRRSQRMP
jgi:predicted nucleic acid-binding protein